LVVGLGGEADVTLLAKASNLRYSTNTATTQQRKGNKVEAIVKLILLAYLMEGIKASDVAFLINREAGCDVFRCMSPQQHLARRATGIKQRIERQMTSYPQEVTVNPGKVMHEGEVQQMYVVEVRVKV
jgi:hypothetical protein